MKKKLIVLVVALAVSTLFFLTCNDESPNLESDKEYEFHKWALTPPMGWNSYDCFGVNVTEAQVRATAEVMADKLLAHGWEYVVIDARWFLTSQINGGYIGGQPNVPENVIDAFVLDEYGRYLPALNKFPSAANGAGFKPLADYIHGLGLKFGLHIMRGIPRLAVKQNLPIKGTAGITANQIHTTSTAQDVQCDWLNENWAIDTSKPGAQEYYDSLFELFAEWGVDFVKIDDIARPYRTRDIEMVRKAIDKTGYPIVLSLSPGERPSQGYTAADMKHVKANANMWRTIDDFWDRWGDVTFLLERSEKWAPHIGPGFWPDGDMIPLGYIGINGDHPPARRSNLTDDEHITVMTALTMFRSPLMFGGDLTYRGTAFKQDYHDFILSLLQNDEAIYINKKSKNTRLLYSKEETIAWVSDDIYGNDKFLALFYPGSERPGHGQTSSGFDKSNALFAEKVTKQTPGHGVDIDIQLKGGTELYLIVSADADGDSCDWADWINPKLYDKEGNETLLTSLTWSSATAGWGGRTPQKNKNIDNGALKVNGVSHDNGIGTHASSTIYYKLPANTYYRFTAFAGLDNGGTDQVGPDNVGAKVEFQVYDSKGIMPESTVITVNLAELGFIGNVKVRDIWDKEDVGVYSGNGFAPEIKFHGAGLYRLTPQ